MKIYVITLFPNIFKFISEEGMVATGIKKGILNLELINLRDYSNDSYQSVDDHPYGGGAGMVMKIEPIYKALKDLNSRISGTKKIILTSAKGKIYKQAKVTEYNKLDNLIIICGHYEGVDERVSEYLIDEEVSIGEYVLSGGEIAAGVIIDSIARTLDGVIGNPESLASESHNEEGILEYPQYTRPESFTLDDGTIAKVPSILLGGNHQEIDKWREENKKRLS